MHFRLNLPDSAFQELVGLLGGSDFHAKRWMQEAEIRMNEDLAEALEEQILVSKANFEMQHRPKDGLGQCMIRMSRKLRHWLLRWESFAFEKDSAFMRKLMTDPNLCLKPSVAKLPRIIKTRNLISDRTPLVTP
jgi:hypothetical protein